MSAAEVLALFPEVAGLGGIVGEDSEAWIVFMNVN